MQAAKEFGVVGLGRMGGNLARQALEKKIGVAGYTLGSAPRDLIEMGLREAHSLKELKSLLAPPRVVFAYIPAGPAIDDFLSEFCDVFDKGDIAVDGGNSYWGDSIRRAQALAEKGFHLVDLGTSGGVSGARQGACFMAGGDPQAISRIEEILKTLSVPGGYVHAGPSGAGHFTKLVHNGIEFGMLQAIAEGVELLERFKDKLPVADVLRCWRNGSVIRSWLVDLMEQSYRSHGGVDDVPAYVEDTGEVNWLVSDALSMEVPIPVIAQSVMQLFASRDSEKIWARSIAMMRNGFGGHPFGPNQAIQTERVEGRVGPPFRRTIEQKSPGERGQRVRSLSGEPDKSS